MVRTAIIHDHVQFVYLGKGLQLQRQVAVERVVAQGLQYFSMLCAPPSPRGIRPERLFLPRAEVVGDAFFYIRTSLFVRVDTRFS